MIPGIEQRHVRSHDGTRIGYQVRGEGPAVVLSNGLGGCHLAFKHLYDRLGHRYRVVCWDYRGLYSSEQPRDLATLDLVAQARDLDAVLGAERIERALFVGWSMGVQLNFEYHRLRPDAFAGVMAINGTFGRVFESVAALRLARRLIPAGLAVMRHQGAALGFLARRSIGWRGLLPAMQRLGMCAPTVDAEVFEAVARGFGDIDFGYYAEMLAALGRHDAEPVLSSVTAPTVIITGDRDLLTPATTARRMHERIPGSRLVVIPGGTHYTPVEFPQVICAELDALLVRSGWAAAGARAATS